MACRMIISPGIVKAISISFSKIKKGKIKKLNLYNFIFCSHARFLRWRQVIQSARNLLNVNKIGGMAQNAYNL